MARKKIDSSSNYTAASAHLAAIDSDWARLVGSVGICLHAPKPEREPYEALVRTVAFQQLHGRAAEAILGRLRLLYAGDLPTPEQLLELDETQLRTCGFSARKILTLKAIAAAAVAGIIPDRIQAHTMPEEELIRRLTTLPGIGRWTVEMMLIYTLERLDIFPVDDFGVREGYRLMKSLDKQLTPKSMREAGLACAPYRTIAAWYLWRATELPEYRKKTKKI